MITAAPPPTALRPAARADFGLGAPAPVTLSDLDTFTLDYVETLRARGTKIDCADLAIEVWIRFGVAHGVRTSFSIRNRAKGSGTLRVRRRNFKTTDAYVRRVQRDLSALGLVRNTFEVPGGYRNAVAGDVYLWEYRLKKRDGSMGRRHYIGHTQIFDWVWVDPDGDATKGRDQRGAGYPAAGGALLHDPQAGLLRDAARGDHRREASPRPAPRRGTSAVSRLRRASVTTG